MLCRNNLDYELALFDPHYLSKVHKYGKYVDQLEYVYFFLQKSPSTLLTNVSYSKDYLHYLLSLGLTLPEFISLPPLSKTIQNLNSKNWWGPLLNLPLEKKLNSKITSTTLALENNLCHEQTKIINTLEEIPLLLKDLPATNYLLKSPYLMAGTGQVYFNSSEFFSTDKTSFLKFQKLKNGPYILEPRLSILFEIGTYFSTFDEDAPPLIHQNILSQNGIHRGSIVFKENSQLLTYLNEKYPDTALPYLWPTLMQNLLHVAKLYRSMIPPNSELSTLSEGFGIDSFCYLDEASKTNSRPLKFYPLLEVNFRKTMGLVAHSLKQFLPPLGVGRFLLVPQNKIRSFSTIQEFYQLISPLHYNEKSQTGAILLSPPSSSIPIKSFLLSATEMGGLKELMEKFSQKILKNDLSGRYEL